MIGNDGYGKAQILGVAHISSLKMIKCQCQIPEEQLQQLGQ